LLKLIATCAAGLEAVLARELESLGYKDLQVENGRVVFTAGLRDIAKANIWLRTAGRVLVLMGAFPALTFDELFEGTKALAWADWLPPDAEFPVSGRARNSKLMSVPDCQAIVKKAIVESLKGRYRRRWFEETGARFPIDVSLNGDIATLTIDTSGTGLHKRGYRPEAGTAPLRETLAAGLVLLSYWQPDRVLLDPCCGAGTIPIEAALIGLNKAPGLERDFAAAAWPVVPKKVWEEEREEAKACIRHEELRIYGSDIDGEAVRLARRNAEKAGVGGAVHWQTLPLSQVRSRYQYGCLICNPPYGERIGDREASESLYIELGKVARQLENWSIYVLTNHPGFERLFGRRADRRRKLYNGRLETTYYQFFGPRPGAAHTLAQAHAHAHKKE